MDKQMELSLKGNTFFLLLNDFDEILKNTVENMEKKSADEATITLKLTVSLQEANVFTRGKSIDFKRPTFKHEINSVMTIKDKVSGSFTGDYELTKDEDGKYVVKRIDFGQVSLLDESI